MTDDGYIPIFLRMARDFVWTAVGIYILIHGLPW